MPKRDDFSRGYFCAVAALIRMDGVVHVGTEELFRAGGNSNALYFADPEDLATFREFGLIGSEGIRSKENLA